MTENEFWKNLSEFAKENRFFFTSPNKQGFIRLLRDSLVCPICALHNSIFPKSIPRFVSFGVAGNIMGLNSSFVTKIARAADNFPGYEDTREKLISVLNPMEYICD